MKPTILIILICLTLGRMAQAENFTAKKSDAGKLQEQNKSTQSVETRKTVPSGVIYEMSEKGLVIISPLASKKEGVGERFLTTRATAVDSASGEEKKFSWSGIKLLGFDF